MPVYSRSKQDYINFFLKATLLMYLKLASKISCHFVFNLQRYDTISLFYQNVYSSLLQKNFSIQERPLYKRLYLRKCSDYFFMFGTILKVTNSSFQKGMTCCRSLYAKKVMKLLAFIFEQPSYMPSVLFLGHRQIMQNQIRCHSLTRCLIRVSTVCLHYFLLKFE